MFSRHPEYYSDIIIENQEVPVYTNMWPVKLRTAVMTFNSNLLSSVCEHLLHQEHITYNEDLIWKWTAVSLLLELEYEDPTLSDKLMKQYEDLRSTLWQLVIDRYGDQLTEYKMLQDLKVRNPDDNWLLLYLIRRINTWGYPYESQLEIVDLLYNKDKSLCAWFIATHYPKAKSYDMDILYGPSSEMQMNILMEKKRILEKYSDLIPLIAKYRDEIRPTDIPEPPYFSSALSLPHKW